MSLLRTRRMRLILGVPFGITTIGDRKCHCDYGIIARDAGQKPVAHNAMFLPRERILIAGKPVSIAAMLRRTGLCWSLSRHRHGLDVARGQGLPSDSPTAALHLFDNHPGYRSHFLALDGNHRVGELANHLLLLILGENAFDDLDLNEWHGDLSALNWDLLDDARPKHSVGSSGHRGGAHLRTTAAAGCS